MAQPGRVHLLPDLWNGAILGDFASRIGVAGAVTQATLSFVPVVGTLCAVRDYFGCRRKGDHLGAVLSLLAIIPVLGGFSKTADVVHSLAIVRRGLHALHEPVELLAVAKKRVRNPLAVVSVLLALATPVLVFLPGNWVLAGLAAPLAAVVAGHIALARAHRFTGARARFGAALTGLIFGYIFLILVSASVALLLTFGRAVGPIGPYR